MTNFTTPQAQEQMIGYWCKQIGLTHASITTHPCADDVVLIYKFRQEFQDMPKYEYNKYLKISNIVIKHKKPLTDKQLRQLVYIAKRMVRIRKRTEQQIGKIQTHRTYRQKRQAEIQQEKTNAGA